MRFPLLETILIASSMLLSTELQAQKKFFLNPTGGRTWKGGAASVVVEREPTGNEQPAIGLAYHHQITPKMKVVKRGASIDLYVVPKIRNITNKTSATLDEAMPGNPTDPALIKETITKRKTYTWIGIGATYYQGKFSIGANVRFNFEKEKRIGEHIRRYVDENGDVTNEIRSGTFVESDDQRIMPTPGIKLGYEIIPKRTQLSLTYNLYKLSSKLDKNTISAELTYKFFK